MGRRKLLTPTKCKPKPTPTIRFQSLTRRFSARATEEQGEAPTWNQLGALFLCTAVPMVGFGFVDNFIMILAGDKIDATLGVRIGISTMAAAALGNLISDVAGIGMGVSCKQKKNKTQTKHKNNTTPAVLARTTEILPLA